MARPQHKVKVESGKVGGVAIGIGIGFGRIWMVPPVTNCMAAWLAALYDLPKPIHLPSPSGILDI